MSLRTFTRWKISASHARPFRLCRNSLNSTYNTLVVLPELIDLVKTVEIEVLVKMHRSIVVEDSVAMKLVVFPLTLVSLVIGLVVESAMPFHLVLAPLPIIVASVLVEELSFSLAKTIDLVTLVPAAYFEMLYYILRLPFHRVGVRDVCSLGELHFLPFRDTFLSDRG